MTIADGCQAKHRADDACLTFDNEQLLLLFVTPHLDRAAFISKRHRSAVVESFLDIPAHRALSVFGRLQREMFVEHCQQVTHEISGRVIAERLG
ncbi:hypothetical protein OKW87_00135 [Sphingomonas sp. M1-B02]|nr:hypothetical protein [Sphingomonas sp. S6-11]UZK66286.1 hypothetical protein OKW87_00135 [Sphingomonas sp. S6-11]